MNRVGVTAGRRRGEPAIALAAVIGCWVLARGAVLAWPGSAILAEEVVTSPPPATQAAAQPHRQLVEAIVFPPADRISVSQAATPLAPAFGTRSALPPTFFPPITLSELPAAPLAPGLPPSTNVRIAASHQLLYLAAFAALPLPPEVLVARPDLAVPGPRQGMQSRWSGDGWLLWRQDAGGLPVGGFAPASYGASQAGAVLRYRLVSDSRHQPLAYLRISSALASSGTSPGQPELAFGFGARPLPRLPVSVLAELRVTESGGRTRVRPAIAAVAGLPRQRLPLGFGIEAYGQAGYVAGPDATAFADGQARLDRRIARLGTSELRGGGAVWGGAQRGAGRLDVGPSASIELRLGPTNARLSADWRFRLAGRAAPASGPAVTLSAGF